VTGESPLPVRVNSAIAMIHMLAHEVAVEFVRPILSQIIRVFLNLIEEIDHDELIEALRTIVEIFGVEIVPHAIELCTKLSEAYLRLLQQNQTTGGQ